MKYKFVESADTQFYSDDQWYALISGGYIRPELLLEDEKQLEKLNSAIDLVQEFFDQAEAAELIEGV